MGRQTKARQKRSGGGIGTIGRAGLGLALLTGFVLLLAAAALFYLEQQRIHQAEIERARSAAQGLAADIGLETGFRRELLQRFVREEGLAGLLRGERWDRLKQLERRFKRLVPGVIRLRILPKEWDERDTAAMPPFSFASLDMLRMVERDGRPSPVEMLYAGKPSQHIALAVPVADDGGNPVGVAHLALGYQMLERLLQQAGGDDIPLWLRQRVQTREASRLLGSRAAAAVRGDPAGTIPVPGTLWHLAYWPAATAGTPDGLAAPLLVLGVALLLITLLILFVVQRLKRLLLQDQQLLVIQMKALLKGKKRRFTELSISELNPVMLAMSAPVKGRRGGGGEAPASPEAVSTGAEEPAVAVAPEQRQPATAAAAPVAIPPEIFRAYDIRGRVDDQLNEAVVERIGQAIGSEAREQGEQTLIVGRDGRHSSPSLSEALCRGLTASGCSVVDLGLVPTPVLYFATHVLGSRSGVMVTGSHNPPEYNGLKVVIAGETLAEERILGLRERIERGDLSQGQGSIQERDLVPDYINRIAEDVQLLAPLKIVVDCGSGAGSVVAPSLFRALGCSVTDLYCEVDGDFPAHHPDPSDPDNLRALVDKVRESGADLGIAFDGDADRLGVVDSEGKIIWPDRLLMLLARDVLMRHPGADVIYDVKSSRHLAGEILAYGGRPIMWKSGHSLIKAKLKETGALLAGELTGHIFFAERWYGFDDGLYSSARLLEVLSAEGIGSAAAFAQLPESITTPELSMPVAEGTGRELMERLTAHGHFPDAKLITIDGIRAEFGDGWGLVRASNTSPALVFRFEADDEAVMARIQALFRDQLLAIDGGLQLPF